MDLIIEFIRKLEADGRAYKAEDGSVYFLVDENQYGKLQNIGVDSQQQTQNPYKRSSKDFALWKASKEGEPYWHSPWGNGRPGWHVECSALASHVLGSNIDIHAGGIDLRFPHHENEEAQSCAYHQTAQWVNYWLHTGHLYLRGSSEKMSKSLKNTVSVQDMLKNTTAEAFRMACAMSHYRKNMEYTEELLETAENLLKVYKNLINSCEEYRRGYLMATVNDDILTHKLGDAYEGIHSALSDDFDTPTVVKVLNELVVTTNYMLHASGSTSVSKSGLCSVTGVSNFVSDTLSMLGISLGGGKSSDSEDFVQIMNMLNDFRQEVRSVGIAGRDGVILKLCDGVRDQLKEVGVMVKDHGKVSSWSK